MEDVQNTQRVKLYQFEGGRGIFKIQSYLGASAGLIKEKPKWGSALISLFGVGSKKFPPKNFSCEVDFGRSIYTEVEIVAAARHELPSRFGKQQ